MLASVRGTLARVDACPLGELPDLGGTAAGCAGRVTSGALPVPLSLGTQSSAHELRGGPLTLEANEPEYG